MRKSGITEMTGRFSQAVVMLLIVLAMTCMVSDKVCAEDYYSYNAAGNTYTISQTSGNITAAMKSALDVATGSPAAPAVIQIQPGTYQLGSIAIKKSNIVIDATGASITADGTADNMLRMSDAQVSNVTIKGGKFNGNQSSKFVFFITGDTNPVSNLTLSGCEVYSAKETNIRISGASNVTLNQVNVHDGEYGLLVLNSKNVTATQCRAKNSTNGLAFRTSEAVLTNCNGDDSLQDGLQVKGAGCQVTVNGGSFCRSDKNGISLTDGASLVMNQVEVSDNRANGISPVGKKGLATRLVATNCNFSRNGRHGVAADFYITLSLSDCKADANGSNGIFLNHGSKAEKLYNITASGNGTLSSDASGSGIALQNESTAALLENCVCDGNGKNGMSLTGLSANLKNCSLSGNKKHGLFVNGTTKNTLTVAGCDIDGNKVNGVSADGSKGAKTIRFQTCSIKQNGNCGIETISCTVKVTGKGNTISENKKHGISNRNGKLIVTNAVVEKNKNYGVYFDGSKSGSTITGSTLKKNLVGVTLSNGAIVNKVSNNTFTNNSKYNLMVYAGKTKTKSKLKACQKNTMSVSKKTGYQIFFEKAAKMPAKIKVTKGKAKKDGCGNTFKVGK